MKTYTALFAIEVPHYGFHDIEAEDDQAAITGAESLFKADTVEYPDPEWANAVCARIVHITDPDGRVISYDKPLDPCFVRCGGEADRLLCENAKDMLVSLEHLLEIARDCLENERAKLEDMERDKYGDYTAADIVGQIADVAILSRAVTDAETVALKARGRA